jgi:hypothetical protein
MHMAKIKRSRCAFDTSVETIKQLRQAQVPDALIVTMLRRGQVAHQAHATIRRGEEGRNEENDKRRMA